MADTIQIKYLAVLLLMIICGFLGIDIHLASMPHIMRYMHTDQQHMQQSISTFLLGMGVSLLFYGPLSDHFGRKPVIIFGLLLAAISSFAAAFSHEISTFLFLRVLQGVGSGVCAGLGRAVLADMYRGNQLTYMASYLGMVVALSPLVAPVIGGYIQAALGWQANFIVLSTIFILALILYTMIFPETNKHRYSSQFSIARIIHNYRYGHSLT
ncbi:MAG: multidrug effflux MFS transporter [Gammaproteobacteria bacterium]|nr:multidrug effflux MFS transporter [Gammaproteobacteria bacterium]